MMKAQVLTIKAEMLINESIKTRTVESSSPDNQGRDVDQLIN